MFHAINIRRLKKPLGCAVLLAGVFLATLYALNMLFPLTHRSLIQAYSDEYGLDPAFVCAVIHAESRFNKDALSPKGANGLMQITEPTAVWLADIMGLAGFDVSQIFDPETNIRIGCFNLKRLLNKYDGDAVLALAAYNAGEGNVKRWLANPALSPDGNTLMAIPFPETREYIRRVEFNTKVYRHMLVIYRRLAHD